MGLFGKFWQTRLPSKPYVDSGLRFVHCLCETLSLPGWKDLLPEYDMEEQKAILAELEKFQRLANSTQGGEVVFHPEVVPHLRRLSTSNALRSLADSGWKYEDRLPQSWKLNVSRYLKAWAGSLDPTLLQEAADILVAAGYKSEVKSALQVILLFPTYASTFWSGADESGALTASIVKRARDGLRQVS